MNVVQEFSGVQAVQVFYEQLQTDPVTQLRRVLRVVGVHPDEGVPAALPHVSSASKYHSESIRKDIGEEVFHTLKAYFKRHAPCFLPQLRSTKPEVFWPPC